MTLTSNRRTLLKAAGVIAAGFGLRSIPADAQSASAGPDVILYNGKITTLDRQNPEAQAVAIREGRFVAAGTDRDVMAQAGAGFP